VTRELILAAFVAIAPSFAAVDVKKGVDRIDVLIDGQPFTTLVYGDATWKPFLAPLRAPSGKIVTRRWPMEEVPGETRDHPHHQGLWFTHGDVNGADFWASTKLGLKSGRVIVETIKTAHGGGKLGEITFEARWMGPDGKPLLRETRRMVFHSDPNNRIIDFDIVLTALDQAVTLGDTKEGTFAIRLADKLAEKGGTGTLINAAGTKNMKNVWGKPSPWVDYSGTLDGEKLGIAIFDHTQNPKHPTTWHARDYGLFAANPFGDHDFYADKTKNGSITIQPRKNLRFRYRVVIHPGDTAEAKVAELYKAWKQ
jgi:Methane oxygenase PmoA